MRFADCQGLAGAWSLGTVQAGFELVHRASLPGGFGDEVMDLNRPLVGDGWEQEEGEASDWTPVQVNYVCGTPPCSGFSLLNMAKGKNARGPDSMINNCMKELIAYGAACTGMDGYPGAEVVAFESVQGAYTQGRGLMQELRRRLSEATGTHYDLTHVKMSGASIGAAQFRRRYFPVFHRVPFGVTEPGHWLLPDGHIVTYADACGDLAGAKLQWEEQRYPKGAGSNYARARRRADGKFTDHVPLDFKKKTPVIERIYAAGWPRGLTLDVACIELGVRPPEIERSWDPEHNEYKGWGWPRRVRGDRCGYVLTGGAGGFLHWDEPRSLTVREISRLMGYPDAWGWPTEKHEKAAAWVGKCCPVQSGQWLSEQVRFSLEGEPGRDQQQIGPGEFLHDSTNLYKTYPGADVPPRED